jgi:hypothetical protein
MICRTSFDRALVVADGMLGFNMKWAPDTATETHFVSLIQLASATQCVLVGTAFFNIIDVGAYELLDLPDSLWNMLADDDLTYVTWNQAGLRKKFNQTFQLDANSINMIDVQASPLSVK